MPLTSYVQEFPFDIMDIAALLNLKIKRQLPFSANADCPFCGDCRGKLNINHQKNVFRCNYCDAHGGMLALYAKAFNICNQDAYRQICEILRIGGSSELPSSHSSNTTLPKSGNPNRAQKPQAVEHEVCNAAPAETHEVHQTLSLLFGILTLSESHRKKLRDRGLTDEQIDHMGYKSTPPSHLCVPLTAYVMQQGHVVKGVPGFYMNDNGKWTVKFHKRTAGIIIPIRGVDGLIRGVQIRLDHPLKDDSDAKDKGAKYIWLSSSNKNMGVTSGSPVHFVGDSFARVIYVTEGALKADIAHTLMNRSFVAVAGANNLCQLEPLLSTLAGNGTQLVVEALDMDKCHNKMVAAGASRIYAMAQTCGMESKRLTWNPDYKGVDDWQLALKKQHVLAFQEAAEIMNQKEDYDRKN